jgi:hypothetical protein
VTVIDRSNSTRPRIARLARLDADSSEKVELTDGGKSWPRSEMNTLRRELENAGLFAGEAEALADIWAHDFFFPKGLTLWYRLPQEEYDRMLPLTLKPRPEKIVRVGLVQQVFDDPRTAQRVARLLRQLDDDDFEQREAAHDELGAMGRRTLPSLFKQRPKIKSVEVKRHVDELLRKYMQELPPE